MAENIFRRLKRRRVGHLPTDSGQLSSQQILAADVVTAYRGQGAAQIVDDRGSSSSIGELEHVAREVRCRPEAKVRFFDHAWDYRPLCQKLQHQLQTYPCVPDASAFEHGDVVVVIQPRRRYFGRLCIVNDSSDEVASISPISDIIVSHQDLLVEVIVPASKKDPSPVSVSIAKEDIRRLAWPATRTPPKSLDELDLVSMNWKLISNKRWSEARLLPAFETLDRSIRGAFTKIAFHTQKLEARIMLQRCRSWEALRELLDVAPQRAATAHRLFAQDAVLPNAGLGTLGRATELSRLWGQLSPGSKRVYDTRAKELLAQAGGDLEKFAMVGSGLGWSEGVAYHFPQSAKRCLRTVLLCQARLSSPASWITVSVWKSCIFPFIPVHWFVKLEPGDGKRDVEEAVRQGCEVIRRRRKTGRCSSTAGFVGWQL